MMKRIIDWLNNFFETPEDRRLKRLEQVHFELLAWVKRLHDAQSESLVLQRVQIEATREATRESRDSYKTLVDILARQTQIGPHL